MENFRTLESLEDIHQYIPKLELFKNLTTPGNSVYRAYNGKRTYFFQYMSYPFYIDGQQIHYELLFRYNSRFLPLPYHDTFFSLLRKLDLYEINVIDFQNCLKKTLYCSE